MSTSQTDEFERLFSALKRAELAAEDARVTFNAAAEAYLAAAQERDKARDAYHALLDGAATSAGAVNLGNDYLATILKRDV